jgi:hypothetical protein
MPGSLLSEFVFSRECTGGAGLRSREGVGDRCHGLDGRASCRADAVGWGGGVRAQCANSVCPSPDSCSQRVGMRGVWAPVLAGACTRQRRDGRRTGYLTQRQHVDHAPTPVCMRSMLGPTDALGSGDALMQSAPFKFCDAVRPRTATWQERPAAGPCVEELCVPAGVCACVCVRLLLAAEAGPLRGAVVAARVCVCMAASRRRRRMSSHQEKGSARPAVHLHLHLRSAPAGDPSLVRALPSCAVWRALCRV